VADSTDSAKVPWLTLIAGIAGMIVVVFALLVLLGIVYIALQELPDDNKSQNIVALSSSAFGVIGAVVGAYFGVRAAGNAMEKVAQEKTGVTAQSGQPEPPTPPSMVS
jgi:uncharacterized membrane protein